jgi:hypothetical protein
MGKRLTIGIEALPVTAGSLTGSAPVSSFCSPVLRSGFRSKTRIVTVTPMVFPGS